MQSPYGKIQGSALSRIIKEILNGALKPDVKMESFTTLYFVLAFWIGRPHRDMIYTPKILYPDLRLTARNGRVSGNITVVLNWNLGEKIHLMPDFLSGSHFKSAVEGWIEQLRDQPPIWDWEQHNLTSWVLMPSWLGLTVEWSSVRDTKMWLRPEFSGTNVSASNAYVLAVYSNVVDMKTSK